MNQRKEFNFQLKKNIMNTLRYRFLLILIFALLLSSCSSNNNLVNNEISALTTEYLKIEESALPFEYGIEKLEALPHFNPQDNDWGNHEAGVDLTSYDLSDLDLSEYYDNLLYASFDSKTIWPDKLPKNFDPNRIAELGKNPGLKVRQLHEKGITGKGVGIAIIDGALLTEHVEYKDSLKHYEVIHWPYSNAFYHGTAVSSIATGKTVGAAPGADLYFFAATMGHEVDDKFERNSAWFTQAVRRVIELNGVLPEDRKIRVISISYAISVNDDSQNDGELLKAIKEAQNQGIFLVSTPYFMLGAYGYYYDGLDRKPLADPDDVNSYEPGLEWAEEYYKNEYLRNVERNSGKNVNEMLLIPMGSRNVAGSTSNKDYFFLRGGGVSWSIPYIAGIYALACQVRPEITPEEFWAASLETGDTIDITYNKNKVQLGKIINPNRLIDSLKK